MNSGEIWRPNQNEEETEIMSAGLNQHGFIKSILQGMVRGGWKYQY